LFFNVLSVWRGLVLMTRAERRPRPKEPRTYLLEREDLVNTLPTRKGELEGRQP